MRALTFKRDVPKRSVHEAALAQKEALLAGEERMTRDLLRAYRAGERELERKLAALVRKMTEARRAGRTVSPAWLYQEARLHEFLAAVNAETARFATTAREIAATQKRQNAYLALAHTAELGRIGGVPASMWIRLPKESVEHVIGQLQPGAPLYDLFAEMPGQTVAGARRAFAVGMTNAENPRVIARRLMREVEGLSRDRAVLIARTETIRGYRYATMDAYRANSEVVSGWRWLSARDRRCCPVCIGMDGTEHPLTEHLESHPGCRCTQLPILRFLDRDIGTGEEWFARQPREVKLAVMQGSERRLAVYEDRGSLQPMIARTEHPRWGGGRRLVPLRDLDPR